MILTKSVKLKWNVKNREYYISKGYKFTKIKDEFEVRIDDLSSGSNAEITIKCDECGKVFTMLYCEYTRKKHDDCLCESCARRMHHYVKPITISFADWGNKKNGKDFLNNFWDYELNTINPYEVSYQNRTIDIYIKCNKHKSYKTTCYRFSTKEQRCPYCKGVKTAREDSFGQYLIDTYGNDALDKYWSKTNTIDPFTIGKYSNKKVIIICQDNHLHHYKAKCAQFVHGAKCAMCTGKQVPPNESFADIYSLWAKLWSDKNIYSPFDYTKSSHKKVWWKCENGIHDDYERTINSSIRFDCRCPSCSDEQLYSRLQTMVYNYLHSMKFNVLHENKCTISPINPKTNSHMFYDNEIEDLKLIIEVHGNFHYYMNGFHQIQAKQKCTTPEEEFEYCQWKDQYKKEYALSHGYEYLEIPYTAEKDDKYKELIDNKINEILGTHTENPVKIIPKSA